MSLSVKMSGENVADLSVATGKNDTKVGSHALAAKQEKRIRLIGIFSIALLLSRLLWSPAGTKTLRPSLV
jgi:hypothetical protein